MPWTGKDDQARMTRHELELELLPGLYAICRLPTDASVPWASGELCCLVRSRSEIQGLTVICDELAVPDEGVEADRGWHAMRFVGSFGFGEVGVLDSVLNPLARAHVPAMTLSSFETDYVLFKAERLKFVKRALMEVGHRFRESIP